MKTFNLVRCLAVVFAMALSLTFFSCSKDDDKSGANESSVVTNDSVIVGKWLLTKEIEWESGSTQKDTTTYQSSMDENMYFQFNTDHSGTIIGGLDDGESSKFTWSISGNKLTMKYGNGDTTVTEVKSVDDEQLIIYSTNTTADGVKMEYLNVFAKEGSEDTSGTTSTTGKSDGMGGTIGKMVDLGLSVKWADHNVGAKTISDYGGLYGWAEPTGLKTSTSNDDYPSANPPSNISGTEYDIAHVKWGGKWRLPTHAEQEELVANCTYSDSTVNGVKGVRFTSKKNHKSIFLPCAGYRSGTYVGRNRGSYGYYWSGSLYTVGSVSAWSLSIFGDGGAYAGYLSNRSYGCSVRPVAE